MRFNQTLVLSGLREKQTSEIKSGVPLLRDIPLLQYLFSNEKTQDFHKSLLILITPRPVTEDIHTKHNADQINTRHLSEFKEKYAAMFETGDNIRYLLRHLSKHNAFKELHQTDIFDRNWWGSNENIDIILARALAFIYY